MSQTTAPAPADAVPTIPNPERRRGPLDVVLLVVRVVVGGIMIAHGIQKFWLVGVPAMSDNFERVGVPLADALVPVLGALEIGGGLALMLGLGTRLLGALFATVSFGGMLFMHLPKGFFATQGGIEFTLLLGVVSLLIATLGAGRFSLDCRIFRGRGPAWLA